MRETMRETPPGMAAPRRRPAAGSAPTAVGLTSGQTTLHAGPFTPLDAWCADFVLPRSENAGLNPG